MSVLYGDCLEIMANLDSESVDCIITSPPYNKKGLIGSAKTGNQIWQKHSIDYDTYGDDMPEGNYQDWMVEVLNEMHRLIKPSGSIFFNHKPRRYKNRALLPTEIIRKSNVELYQLIIWDRTNSPNIRKEILVPSTEHIYWLCKDKPKVFRDKVDHKGEVWRIVAQKQEGHPAPFTQEVVRNCMLLSTEKGDKVLDPFSGSGTTGVVAKKLGREFVGMEISQMYYDLSEKRINETNRERNLLGFQ